MIQAEAFGWASRPASNGLWISSPWTCGHTAPTQS